MKQLLLLLIIFIFSYAQQKEIKKEFEKTDRLLIETNSGNVDLMKSSDDKIYVKVTYTHDEEDFKPMIEKRGKKIHIKEQSDGGWNWRRRSSGDSFWEIKIPDGMQVSFNTGSGDFTTEDLSFEEFEGNAGSGDFKFADTKGEIEINIGSGDMNFSRHVGEIEVNSGSGDVEAKNIESKLKVNIGSGDVDVNDFSGYFKINTGSGTIELNEVAVKGRSSANSGSGDVTLLMSESPKDDIDINSGSGDITLDYNGNSISGYFELTARYEDRIRTPFKYKTEKRIEKHGDDYFLKIAEVGDKSPSFYINTGSGVIKIVK